MGQLYDLHFANHLYESGTMQCTGILEVELGKALVVLPEKENAKKKIYYIEGYEHSWQYPNIWKTTLTLTHGQFQDENLPFIDVATEDGGQPDKTLESSYLRQTFIDRK